ncbi:hypothetical protein MSP7336_03132 [Mycobacterium shimoidei]|uniref:Uncharacterized protein n=1 Tax=Mycobacterium shimoidei TaxID=29313 RepID=A0A375Z174_MYCSH|nr:hypothetical protein MSP7336_03132 [Mycobacterium shimoidei]
MRAWHRGFGWCRFTAAEWADGRQNLTDFLMFLGWTIPIPFRNLSET